MTERTFNTIAIIFSLSLIVALCIYECYMPPKPPKVPIRTTQADAGEVMTRPPMPGIADPFRPFLNALMQVESGGDGYAVGDGGRSRGPYQIGRAYWQDGYGGDYDINVLHLSTCEVVMFAYWNRYCRKALSELDFETLARIHVGGPRGDVKESTKPYWLKVKAAMETTVQIWEQNDGKATDGI